MKDAWTQTDVGEVEEIMKMTVESLRRELKDNDLSRSGTKAELAARVQHARCRAHGIRPESLS